MILLDTNIVIPWLRSAGSPTTEYAEALVERSLVALSRVTVFELQRKQALMELQGAGRKQRVRLAKLLASVPVLELDRDVFDVATKWWAFAQAHKPAITFTDADLLIASTAAAHGHQLATAEVGLVENLRRLNFPADVLQIPG